MDALQTFLSYADKYDRTNTKVELKIEHTLAVTDIMKNLTDSLKLPSHTAQLARLCAIFHDIGRFEQLKRYDTFLDHISIDHALLGCEILKQEKLLSHLPTHEQEMVLTAVRNHNQYAIEDGLDGDTLLLCRLIRDADKCDIFRVFAFEEFKDTVGETADQIERETISGPVLDALFSHHCVNREDRVTGLDICVSFLAFFYDMYFTESLELLMKQKYYRIPFQKLNIADSESRLRLLQIMEEVEAYVKCRLECRA